MATQFGNFKVSFIWVETIPAIAAQQLGDKAPWGFLGIPGQFAKKFGELKAGGSSPELELPWQKPQGHHFWKYYFAGRHAGDIAGNDAWKSRVPLRNKTAAKFAMEPPKPEDPQGAKVTFEVFYTPQGLGLVANAYYKGEDRLAQDIVQLAHGVRYRYRFRRDAERAGGGMSLESAADHALATARKQAFGDAEAFSGRNQPFTIATFVHGQTDMPDVAEGSAVHRVLEALTGWNQDWPKMPLDHASLASARLAIHRQSKDDIVYARANGRAIWLPREFSKPHPASTTTILLSSESDACEFASNEPRRVRGPGSRTAPTWRKSAAPAPAARSGGRLCAGQARNGRSQGDLPHDERRRAN